MSHEFVSLFDSAASATEEQLEETFGFAQTVVGECYGFHHRGERRIEVQADDVANLVDEQRIARNIQ